MPTRATHWWPPLEAVSDLTTALQGEPAVDLPPERLLRSKEAAAGTNSPMELFNDQFEAEIQRRGFKASRIEGEIWNIVMTVAAVLLRRALPTHPTCRWQ